MASGTIHGTTNNEFIICKIEWSSVADVSTNKSRLTAALYYKRTNTGYTTYGIGTFELNIGNSMFVSERATSTTIGESWVKVAEGSTNIAHNEDGTKSVFLEVKTGRIMGTSLESTTCGAEITLDTIPRETTVDKLDPRTYFDGTFKVYYTPKRNLYYNRLYVDLNLDGNLIPVTSYNLGKSEASQTSFYYELSSSEKSIVYNKLPNSTKVTLRYTMRTYSDSGYSVEVGSGSYKEITSSIPENSTTRPMVSMSLSPLSSLPSPYNSLYIQGHSKVKAALSCTARCGATIVASSVTVNEKTYGSPYESDILTQTENVTVKATAKDSRGFYGTYYKDIYVIPYAKPYLAAKSGETSIIAARCDGSANFTDSGTYLKIKAKAVYSKVVDANGTQHNYGVIKFRYRKEGGAYSAWQTILDCEKDKSDEVITPPLLNGVLAKESNYQVQIIVSDDLYESAPITFAIPSDKVFMDRPAGGKSMGLGGYSSGDGNLDVHWKTKARGGVSLFDSKGDEIPLASTMPLPRGQVAENWNPNSLENGVYVVAKNYALKTDEGNVIMYNGVLIQMPGDVGSNVKIQLAFPVDGGRSPMQRLCWYGTWSTWQSMKL